MYPVVAVLVLLVVAVVLADLLVLSLAELRVAFFHFLVFSLLTVVLPLT